MVVLQEIFVFLYTKNLVFIIIFLDMMEKKYDWEVQGFCRFFFNLSVK